MQADQRVPVAPFEIILFRIQNRFAWSNCCLQRVYSDVPTQLHDIEHTYIFLRLLITEEIGVDNARYAVCMNFVDQFGDDSNDLIMVNDNRADALMRFLEDRGVRFTKELNSAHYLDEHGNENNTLYVYSTPQEYRCGIGFIYRKFTNIPSYAVEDLEIILSEDIETRSPTELFVLLGKRPVVYTSHLSSIRDVERFLLDEQVFGEAP